MTQERKIFQLVTSSDVCEIYELLHRRGFISFPLTQEGRNKVDAIVANITSSYFGTEIYPSAEEKAVAYLYYLIKDHPFTDGNKRTASVVFFVVCDLNNLVTVASSFPLDALAVFTEKVRGDEDHHKVIRIIAGALFTENQKASEN